MTIVEVSRVLDLVMEIPEDVRGPMEKIQKWADVTRILRLWKNHQQNIMGNPRRSGFSYSDYAVVL